jgi:hypothetical protein
MTPASDRRRWGVSGQGQPWQKAAVWCLDHPSVSLTMLVQTRRSDYD